MNLTPAQTDQLDRLEAKVASMRLQTPQDAIRFVPKAALLAALGRPRFAHRWQTLHHEIGFDWVELLRRRADEGCWDLENSGGEFLAFAVFDAQEFYLFRRGDGGLLFGDGASPTAVSPETRGLRNAFEDWFDRANEVELDDVAAAMISDYRARYPVALESCLQPMGNPMAEWMRRLAPAHGTGQTVIDVRWPSVGQPPDGGVGAEVSPLARKLADRHVTKYLQKKLEREGRFDLPGGTPVVVSCSISRHWVIHVSVTSPQMDLLPVRSVRLGGTAAMPRGFDNTGTWLIHLQPLEQAQQDQLLRDPLLVRFANGYTLRIAGESP